MVASLRGEYEQKIAHEQEALDGLRLEKSQLETEELQWARRHLLLVEKEQVIDASHQGVISQAVHEKLLADIDARLLRLESGENDEATEQRLPVKRKTDGWGCRHEKAGMKRSQ